MAKFIGGKTNTYEATLPEREQYVQEKSKFECDRRVEEKIANFLPKGASYEI
jgi:hypothetical protein